MYSHGLGGSPISSGYLQAMALLAWHGAVRREHGLDAVLDAVEKLQGAPIPASILESEVLPARVEGYLPGDLDALAASGEVLWVGLEPIGERDGRVALYLADALPRLIAPEQAPAAAPDGERERLILEHLARRGASFFAELHASGFQRRGGQLACTYFDENFLNMVPVEHVEGLYGCLDYYQAVDDPFSAALLRRYDQRFPGAAKFTGGGACSGLYRGLKLWEAAVKEAGSLVQDDVIRALDHARIAEGPGGPAEMVPGQHHVRMNMYISRSENGAFKVVENLGHIDPQEGEVPLA